MNSELYPGLLQSSKMESFQNELKTKSCRRSLRSATLLKKRLWSRCFPVNLVKFLRTPFLQNISGRLLLMLLTIAVKSRIIDFCESSPYASATKLNKFTEQIRLICLNFNCTSKYTINMLYGSYYKRSVVVLAFLRIAFHSEA